MHFDNANLLGAVGEWKEFGVETSVGRKQGAQHFPSTPTPFCRPRNAFHFKKVCQYSSCKSTIEQICEFAFTKIANDQGSVCVWRSYFVPTEYPFMWSKKNLRVISMVFVYASCEFYYCL